MMSSNYEEKSFSQELDEMNVNKYKASIANLHSTEKEYQEALLFFYEVETIEEVEEVLKQEKYMKDKQKGTIGENIVNYSLKWLPACYRKIEPLKVGKYGEKCIKLLNQEFIDECQEFDHIIVGPQGIFMIETKNFLGKIRIDDNGNWIREKSDGTIEGERNPLEQIRRHQKLLASIVGSVEIISIICLSHPKVIIEGIENCPVKILKSDLLCDYIENYKGKQEYTDEEIRAILRTIQKYQINAKNNYN